MQNRPKIIFVIGNPCTGKSSFSSIISDEYKYIKADDVEPLYEIFNGDKILYKNDIEVTEKENEWNSYLSKVKYVKNLWVSNQLSKEPCNYYSKPADTGGFNILKPEVWDIVLDLKSKELSSQENYIFEFSRGIDTKYLDMKNISKEDVYKSAFEVIMKNLDCNESELIIINFYSDLKDRKDRNIIRFNEGGHLISDKGMNEIYRDDIFSYSNTDKDKGFLEVNNMNIPVISIEVPHLSKDNRKEFFLDKYSEAIELFNNNSFKGD